LVGSPSFLASLSTGKFDSKKNADQVVSVVDIERISKMSLDHNRHHQMVQMNVLIVVMQLAHDVRNDKPLTAIVNRSSSA
jgi:hypothetical protein